MLSPQALYTLLRKRAYSVPLERTRFDEISESDVSELIELGVSENLQIEYKRELVGNSDEEKVKALKAITAFANTAGGHLIIGIDAPNGIPVRMTPLQEDHADSQICKLQSLIQQLVEPRIFGIDIRPVKVTDGTLIILRIPKSWNPPHRVNVGKKKAFYIRNSSGAHEASVEELRVLFNLGSDLTKRIKEFRLERIELVTMGKAPVQIPRNGRLFVHLIPLSAFGSAHQIDLDQAFEVDVPVHGGQPSMFEPIRSSGSRRGFNLDGYINRGGSDGTCYTQIFRNGILEAATSGILRVAPDGQRILSARNAHQEPLKAIPRFFSGLRLLAVPAPFFVMFTYQDVNGALFSTNNTGSDLSTVQPFPNNDLMNLPEVTINDLNGIDNISEILKPIFDALWNAAGFPGFH